VALRQHASVLLTLATIPVAIAMALLVARVSAAQTPLQRCAYLIERTPTDVAGHPGSARRRAYQRCLADPIGFVP